FGVLTAERYRSTVADIVRPSASARLCEALSRRAAGRLVALVAFLAGFLAAFLAAFFVAGIRRPSSDEQRVNNDASAAWKRSALVRRGRSSGTFEVRLQEQSPAASLATEVTARGSS